MLKAGRERSAALLSQLEKRGLVVDCLEPSTTTSWKEFTNLLVRVFGVAAISRFSRSVAGKLAVCSRCGKIMRFLPFATGFPIDDRRPQGENSEQVPYQCSTCRHLFAG